jgi:small subunit ribosomal protein S6|uniref:Small ribosomal subunit protein bS6c n=2 Tax=Cyanidioschyzon merolae TaxID=45157 RepID=RR6_CYAM1|nr:ribosomal protein S6 [Cyanidioschyzon merolae strain 10D]Q85G29.1 RecName: Full=Small ribosomal subunit protein bS6c; AltName: Full=30S ribosomal protein S6, chloroplastic [Cyanidioschyzon merolae strain 10D]QFV16963.1 30S ribosomal protein S6 [Cyanidioschyzon merolae]QFV17141.1 30S ribosomal protein S6 [Cyanidioschyzon merolae]BAC76162.1 30S ribosomal protein S6 [Cyanidioschyzon merolae strain 10D]
MKTQMKKPWIEYELMWLIRPDLNQEEIKKEIEAVMKVLEESRRVQLNGKTTRKLAYKIGKYEEGHYVQMEFDGYGRIVKKLEKYLQVNEKGLRYMILRK